jgi:hypothetical protein
VKGRERTETKDNLNLDHGMLSETERHADRKKERETRRRDKKTERQTGLTKLLGLDDLNLDHGRFEGDLGGRRANADLHGACKKKR